MVRKTAVGFALVLAILLVGSVLHAQQVEAQTSTAGISLSASADSQTMARNGRVRISVTLRWTGKEGDYSLVSLSPPTLENLLVLESEKANEKHASGEAATFVYRTQYLLVPETEGKAVVYPFKAVYKQGQDGQTGSLVTERIDLDVGPPEYGILEVERNVKLLVFLGALAIVAAALLLARKLVIVREQKRVKLVQMQGPDPRVQFEERLKNIEQLKSRSEYIEVHEELSGALKDFIQRQYRFHAGEMTTSDFVAKIEQMGMSGEMASRVRETLQACDFVKYTGQMPDLTSTSGVLEAAREILEKMETKG